MDSLIVWSCAVVACIVVEILTVSLVMVWFLLCKNSHAISHGFLSVPGMALIQSEIVRPQVVTAKCSEPQADTIKVGVKEVV